MEFVKFIIAPIISAFVTWFFTQKVMTKKQKNDFQTTLLNRVEELTNKLLDLNDKLIKADEEISVLKKENLKLKNEIDELKEWKITQK